VGGAKTNLESEEAVPARRKRVPEPPIDASGYPFVVVLEDLLSQLKVFTEVLLALTEKVSNIDARVSGMNAKLARMGEALELPGAPR
jgi:hypothetical protein